MPPRSKLTAYDRILLHLDEFSRFEEEAQPPHAVSQNGIADRTGLLRSHIPRAIRILLGKGMITERIAHVKGGARSRHVYFPTWEGSATARELRAELEAAPVTVKLRSGTRTVKAAEVSGLLGIRTAILDVAIAARKGPITREMLKGELSKEGFVESCEHAPAPRPFFGRKDELQTVLGWLAGDTRVVCILGVSGIGKSSTALGVLNELKGMKHQLWLPIHEWDTLPGMLRPLADFLERTGRRKLTRYLAENPAPKLPSVHELLRAEFEGLGAVICVDDLQKAGPELTDGVRAMADAAIHVNGPRLLVLSREKRKLSNPDAAARGLVRELSLGGLDAESAARLMGNGVPAEERPRIIAATGGHPLYIELLARRGAAAGREAIEEHLRKEIYARLPADERRCLGAAAVLGREAPASALLAPGGDIGVLDGLVEKNLLVRSASGMYSMHDTLREFFLSRLSPQEKVENHRRAAKYLLGREGDFGPETVLEALRHLMLAGENAAAASTAVDRGRELADAGLGRALLSEVLDRLGPDDCGKERWGALLLLRADLRAAGVERDRALQEYREAASIGGETAARAWYGIGEVLRERSDWEGAADAYTRSAALSPSLKPESLRGLACIAWRNGEWASSSRQFSDALKLARREGRGALAASVLIDVANLESDRGSNGKALSTYHQALKALETGNQMREMARVHNNIGAVLFYEGRWDEALEHYQKCLELSERCGEVSTSAYALSNIGQILARKGEQERALKYIDASSGIFERLGDDFMRSSNMLAKGILYRTVRDWERSEDHFRQGLEVLEGLRMPREMAEARFEHGVALKAKGDIARARKELELARDQYRKLGAASELERAERELNGLKTKKG